MTPPPSPLTACRAELLHLLRDRSHGGAAATAPRVRELLQQLERLQPANLTIDSDQLDDIMGGKEPRPPKDWTPRAPSSGGGGGSGGADGGGAVDLDFVEAQLIRVVEEHDPSNAKRPFTWF